MVLDNGNIAEFDSPQVLLDNNKSLFYAMCKDAGINVNAGTGNGAHHGNGDGAHHSNGDGANESSHGGDAQS